MFHERVIEAREKQGWTQAQLGSRVGSKNSRISKIERGDQEPKLSDVKKFAEALGVKQAWLVAEELGLTQEPTLQREAIEAAIMALQANKCLEKDPGRIAEFLAKVTSFYGNPLKPRSREGMTDAIDALFEDSGLK